jgi:hypothetical protein
LLFSKGNWDLLGLWMLLIGPLVHSAGRAKKCLEVTKNKKQMLYTLMRGPDWEKLNRGLTFGLTGMWDMVLIFLYSIEL